MFDKMLDKTGSGARKAAEALIIVEGFLKEKNGHLFQDPNSEISLSMLIFNLSRVS